MAMCYRFQLMCIVSLNKGTNVGTYAATMSEFFIKINFRFLFLSRQTIVLLKCREKR